MTAGYSKGQVIALGAIFGALPIPFVLLRFYARRLTRAPFKVDDWLIIPAVIFNLAIGTVLIADAIHGELGSHQSKVFGPDGQLIMHRELVNYEKMKIVIHLLNLSILGICKLSVLFLYRRIFVTKPFQTVVDVMIGVVLVWALGFLVADLCQCIPISVIWTKFEYEYANYCVDVVSFYWAISVTDAVTDFIILALPLPMVWNLRLPLQQKVAVGGMFLLGGCVVAASLARLIVFIQVGRDLMVHFDDVTYYTTPVFYWSTIEGSLSCISACLPTLRPVLLKWLPLSITGGSRRSTSKGSSFGNLTADAQKPSYRIDGTSRNSPTPSSDKARNSSMDDDKGSDLELGALYHATVTETNNTSSSATLHNSLNSTTIPSPKLDFSPEDEVASSADRRHWSVLRGVKGEDERVQEEQGEYSRMSRGTAPSLHSIHVHRDMRWEREHI
ncbi:hypothetical protein P152DRAFT_411238 [Eremomyces bilateralis CBS 781.70]|uniref:Rhodopsin domain-containing protein n=1 Tax=Eremomyces bilateralis CBS 781.70 TaxID=1392243 RepID=A0A6G1GDE6_9PEZI|nr:uncharacterized protein P152DRAFT_411238 [Eremomyces bilateralis CBS 781.70]KAF1815936.1 hypothetical protein P152DRAFT_411238 [Eremomyces bilateralis CBS 781.70]